MTNDKIKSKMTTTSCLVPSGIPAFCQCKTWRNQETRKDIFEMPAAMLYVHCRSDIWMGRGVCMAVLVVSGCASVTTRGRLIFALSYLNPKAKPPISTPKVAAGALRLLARLANHMCLFMLYVIL